MDRMVRVKVCGHYLVKDNRKAGVQHESNAVVMRIEFDPGWDGMAKKITFWNADGKNPVERLLTADLLEDMSVDTRTYLCPIPGEAMDEAGEMTFIIDGYVDGKRQRSISDTLKVEAAPFIERADEPSDPTPSQAEQLQAQIDTLLGDVQAAAERAEQALADALRARDEAVAIIGGTLGPESLLDRKADLVNGKVPASQLPAMNYAAMTHAIRHKAGGADPLTAADVGAVPAVATYYTVESAKSADDLTVPFALIPVGATINADLYAICGSSFAYVYTGFYISASTESRRMQIACTYNSVNPKIAMRIFGSTGWTKWRGIADTDYAVNKAGDTMRGILQVSMGGGNATVVADPACAYMQAFRDNSWDNRRTLLLRTKETSPDMTNALAISSAGADAAEYTVLHTGNLHLLDSLNLGGAKIKVGSYTGNGAYGGSSPNSIQLDFEPDMVIVQDAGMTGATVWGMWIRGCLMFMVPNTTYSSFVQDSSRNFKWASTASAAGQFNSSGVPYGYLAISFG